MRLPLKHMKMQDSVTQGFMDRQPLQERSLFTDNIISSKTSVVQPVRKENQTVKPLFMSPVLPGTGSITHNVTRLLANKTEEIRDRRSPPESFTYPGGYVCSGRQELFTTPKTNTSTSDDDLIDVENESQELHMTCDTTNSTDTSISTRGSASPHSTDGTSSPTSSTSSPGSGCGSVTSPEPEGPPVKKKARTNYRPDQLKALERQFHENPYPDADMMEQLSQDLGIPENKLKIWFQNKRARWRRRMNDNMNKPYSHFMPMSPVLPQMTPYGLMPTTPFMTSSPSQGMSGPGLINYQGQVSPNNSHQTNPNFSRVPSTNQMQNHNQLTSHGMQSAVLTTSHSLMTSPNRYLSHNYRHLQYQPYLYENFGTYSPKN